MKMRFLRLCSIALILALLINLLPAQAIARNLDEIRMADTSGQTLSEENASEESVASSAKIIAEIPEKRTAFTKDYKLSNGLHMSVVYPEVVHYEDNGQWKEIDNTLKISPNFLAEYH